MDFFIQRKNCPACLSLNSKVILQKSYNDGDLQQYLIDFYSPQGNYRSEHIENGIYSLLKCNGCGLLFQKNIPNDQLMQEIYTEWIEEKVGGAYEEVREITDKRPSILFELLLLSHRLRPQVRSIKMLDFGLGWSEWSVVAKDLGFDVYGTEINNEQIIFAKKHGIKILNEKDLQSYKFDIINVEQVFEHVESPFVLMKTLASVLQKGGLMKIAIPNVSGIENKIKENKTVDFHKLNPIAPLEHINSFTPQSLDFLASQFNLSAYHFSFKDITFSPFDKNKLKTASYKTVVLGLLYYLYRDLFQSGICRWYRNMGSQS